MVSGVKIIKREELKGHQYIEGYARRLESKLVEWDEGTNVGAFETTND